MSSKHTTLPLIFALSASLMACDSSSDRHAHNDYPNFSTCYKELHKQDYCRQFDQDDVNASLNQGTTNVHGSMSATSAAVVAGATGYYAGKKSAQQRTGSGSSKKSGGWGSSFKSSSGG